VQTLQEEIGNGGGHGVSLNIVMENASIVFFQARWRTRAGM
jgi:hypothetical protein